MAGTSVIKRLKHIMLLAGGWLLLCIGIAGIFIPLLPTTPLLLLSAFCFFHSSDKWYNWLINHKRFGTPIRNFRMHRAISLRAKVMSLLLLWGSITSSALLMVPLLWIRLLLFVIAVGVTAYILSLRTLSSSFIEQADEAGLENE